MSMEKSRREFLGTASVGLVAAIAVSGGVADAVTAAPGAADSTAAAVVGLQEPTVGPAGAPPAFGAGPAFGPEVSTTTFREAEKLVQIQLNDGRAGRGSGELAEDDGGVVRTARRAEESRDRERRRAVIRNGIRCCRGGRLVRRAMHLCAAVTMRERCRRATRTIAYAPVSKLSRWIERKQLTSERLTQIYLARHREVRSEVAMRDHADRRTMRLRARRRLTRKSRQGSIAGRCTGFRTA